MINEASSTDDMISGLEESGGGDIAWWLREFKELYETGNSPVESANELYFRVEQAPEDISLLLATAVVFGIVWETEDESPNQ